MLKVIILTCVLVVYSFGLSFDRFYYGTIENKSVTLSISQSDQENQVEKYQTTEKEITGYLTFKDAKQEQYFGTLNKSKIEFRMYKLDETTYKKFKHNSSFEGILTDKGINGRLIFHGKSFALNLISAPWDDGQLTCDEMHKYKNVVFSRGASIDLGTGLGSPIDVDYDCNGTIATLPFMRGMFLISNAVRGYLSWSCYGSMQEAIYRYDHFDLLEAGLAPELFAKSIYDKYWFSNGDVSHDETIRRMQNYFKLWGHQSLHNYEVYNSFWDEYVKTLPQLTKYYQDTFHVDHEKATLYATSVMHHIFAHATGSFSSSFMEGKPSISELDKVLIFSKSTPAQIAQKISQATQDELNQGLKTAILHNRSMNDLETLIKGGAKIDSGHESALFFALKNPDIVKFLLAHKANVNYTNSFGKTPLFYAIGYNDKEMTKLLLDHGANIKQRYYSKAQIEKFEYKEDSRMPFYLFGVSCSLTSTLRTPLLHAAQNADVEMMKLLIANGASIKDKDENEETLADYAQKSNKPENIAFVQFLGSKKKTY